MKIQTKFEIGQEIWFYDLGKINKAKIRHITTDNNSENTINYDVERKDKEYRYYFDYDRSYMSSMHREDMPATRFNEEDISDTKEGLKRVLRLKEIARHDLQMGRIEDLFE